MGENLLLCMLVLGILVSIIIIFCAALIYQIHRKLQRKSRRQKVYQNFRKSQNDNSKNDKEHNNEKIPIIVTSTPLHVHSNSHGLPSTQATSVKSTISNNSTNSTILSS